MGGLIILALTLAGIWLLIKVLPVILKLMKYCVLAIPLWILFTFIPGFLDEVILFFILMLFAFIKAMDTCCLRGYGNDSGNYYVLNKKTGVIHNFWDSSTDTIGENHRRMISYTEAQDLINRGSRYRFKQDP